MATRAVALIHRPYRIIVELQLIIEKQWIATLISILFCQKINYVKNLLFQDFYLKRKIVHSISRSILHSFHIQFYLKFSL